MGEEILRKEEEVRMEKIRIKQEEDTKEREEALKEKKRQAEIDMLEAEDERMKKEEEKMILLQQAQDEYWEKKLDAERRAREERLTNQEEKVKEKGNFRADKSERALDKKNEQREVSNYFTNKRSMPKIDTKSVVETVAQLEERNKEIGKRQAMESAAKVIAETKSREQQKVSSDSGSQYNKITGKTSTKEVPKLSQSSANFVSKQSSKTLNLKQESKTIPVYDWNNLKTDRKKLPLTPVHSSPPPVSSPPTPVPRLDLREMTRYKGAPTKTTQNIQKEQSSTTKPIRMNAEDERKTSIKNFPIRQKIKIDEKSSEPLSDKNNDESTLDREKKRKFSKISIK